MTNKKNTDYKQRMSFSFWVQVLVIAYFIAMTIALAVTCLPSNDNRLSFYIPFFYFNNSDTLSLTKFAFIFFTLFKVLNVSSALVSYPSKYNSKKYSFFNIILALLDTVLTGFLIFALLTGSVEIFSFGDGYILPLWLKVVYFILPLAILGLSCLAFNAYVFLSKFKLKNEENQEAASSHRLSKKQSITLIAFSSLALIVLLVSFFLPASADKILYGKSFENDFADMYIDHIDQLIFRTNYTYEKGHIDTDYFDIQMTTSIDNTKVVNPITTDGNMIYMTYNFHNRADDKDYATKVTGTRKWFGIYKLEFTDDFETAFEGCPLT